MSLLAELRQSSRLAVGVAASAATVGAIYGYDSSNIAGALLFLTPEFGLTADTQGLVTTAVVIGEIAGALFGGALANRIGRKPVMVGVAATFALFSLLCGLAWERAVADRGPAAARPDHRRVRRGRPGVHRRVRAPQRIRGSLLVMYQVATVTGIILGYLIAWGLAESGNWRLMLGAAAIPGALITLALLRLPDTPRWYMMRGRVDEARTVLRRDRAGGRHRGRAGRHPGRADRGARRRGYPRAAAQALPAGRVFVIGLGFFVQATGINAIVYYSPRIFEAMGFTGSAATLGLPALVQVAGLLAVFCSVVAGRPARSAADPAHRNRDHGAGQRRAGGHLLDRQRLRRRAHRARLHRAAAVHRRLHLRLRRPGLGLRRGELPGPAALARRQRHADRQPDRQRRGRRGLPAPAGVAGRRGTFVLFGLLAVAAFGFVLKMAPETKGRPLEDIRHYWENDGNWPSSPARGTPARSTNGSAR